MRRTRRAWVLGAATMLASAIGIAGVAQTSACTPQARAAIVEVLDDVAKGCVWENAHLDLPLIKQVCQLASFSDAVVRLVLDDFFAHRETIRQYVARYEHAMRTGGPFPSLEATRKDP